MKAKCDLQFAINSEHAILLAFREHISKFLAFLLPKDFHSSEELIRSKQRYKLFYKFTLCMVSVSIASPNLIEDLHALLASL